MSELLNKELTEPFRDIDLIIGCFSGDKKHRQLDPLSKASFLEVLSLKQKGKVRLSSADILIEKILRWKL